jgi:hypothetical protein
LGKNRSEWNAVCWQHAGPNGDASARARIAAAAGHGNGREPRAKIDGGGGGGGWLPCDRPGRCFFEVQVRAGPD